MSHLVWIFRFRISKDFSLFIFSFVFLICVFDKKRRKEYKQEDINVKNIINERFIIVYLFPFFSNALFPVETKDINHNTYSKHTLIILISYLYLSYLYQELRNIWYFPNLPLTLSLRLSSQFLREVKIRFVMLFTWFTTTSVS